jgi:heptosyltransferase-2
VSPPRATDTLVVAPSWVGDAVLSHPFLVRLKERDPSGRIDVLAPPWVLPVYQRMAEVDGVIPQPFGHGEMLFGERRRFARGLRKYDRAVVLPNSWKSALIPWHAGIPKRTGYIGELRYGLLNDARALDKVSLPLIVDRYAALAQPAREPLRRPLPAPHLRVTEASRRGTLHAYRLSVDRPVTVMAPGAEYGPAKRWPARHFASLARMLAARGHAVWLFGSKKDAPVTDEIQQLSGGACVDLAGRTTLDEAIDLMSFASRVVTNDSGLMHIAAALDRPMVALFGSSSPDFTPPLSAHARVINLKLACSPCFKRECPLGHTNCLVTIEPQKVFESLP